MGRTAFMSSLDVLVHPSLAEGTPNSVIEAMAHGVPVIASRVGGIPDIIDDESGILVPPGDAAALAEAMRLLAADPARRQQMGIAAKARHQKLFAPQAVVPLMVHTYHRLACNGNGSHPTMANNVHSHPWSQV